MSSPTQSEAAPAAHCLNCLYTLSTPRPRFCGHCGQETRLHPPSMHEFVHEFIGHYVALEGPLWRSLWALVFLPGRLTREYFAGRRRRYVLPLRIYLTASFLFFVGGHLLPHGDEDAPAEGGVLVQQSRSDRTRQAGDEESAATREGRKTGKAALQEMGSGIAPCLAAGARCGWMDTQVARALDKLQRTDGRQWQGRMGALAPYAMLVMQPVFALILLPIFAGSGRRYAEHFVFSLHIHAFWFLVLLLEQLVGGGDLLLAAAFIHGLVALRTVYGRGWWANLWRSLMAALLYLIALALGTAVLAVVAVLAS
jgi:hypothetical protein